MTKKAHFPLETALRLETFMRALLSGTSKYNFIPLRIPKKIYLTNKVAASLMTRFSFVSVFFIKIKTVANVAVMTVTWFHMNESGKSYPLWSCNSLSMWLSFVDTL